MILSLDIETTCNVKSCPYYGKETICQNDHGLHHKKNKITKIAVYSKFIQRVFNTPLEFKQWWETLKDKPDLVGHNLKFDLKTLSSYYIDLIPYYKHDTQVMALAHTKKVSKLYLKRYEERRKEINKTLRGWSHRDAGSYSLKTVAPYYLGVDPFWEVGNHADDAYVLKDAEYTYGLFYYFKDKLIEENTYEFYEEKLMPWQKLLMTMEMRGVKIDVEGILKLRGELVPKKKVVLEKLREHWGRYYDLYRYNQEQILIDDYNVKANAAVEKYKGTKRFLKDSDEVKQLRYADIKAKSEERCRTAIGKLPYDINLNSDKQKLWLFEECLGINCEIKVRNKETNKVEIKKTTGKELIEREILKGREDFKTYKEYQDIEKILTGFIPSYLEKQHEGILYCSYNITGTRTGRISSNSPNLQQVPPILRDFFVGRDHHSLATYDMSAIEPNLIAYYSECPVLCRLLLDKDNFHNVATQDFFPYTKDTSSKDIKNVFKKERNCAKQCDLSILYGSGVGMLQQTYLKHGFSVKRDDAKDRLEKFKDTFGQVFKFKRSLDRSLENKEVVTNLLGRKFMIADLNDVYMKGFNSLIQGSASDLVLESARRIEEAGLKVLMLVHDEIVVEIPNTNTEENINIITKAMTDYHLPTKYGNLELEVEGCVGNVWEK